MISSASWGMLHSTDNALWTDLVENPIDGLVYKKFREMPFTGTIMATAEDPTQRSYKNGSKHGEWTEFDDDGQVKAKSQFDNGRIQTKADFEDGKEITVAEYKYYENGQLKYKWNRIRGQRHGLQEGFYENGRLSFKTNYKDGEQHGVQENYHENGQLSSKAYYKAGKK